jgi:hypothetical protein
MTLRLSSFGILAVSLLLGGCVNGWYEAPAGSEIHLDSDVLIPESTAYLSMDAVGTLLILEAYVTNGESEYLPYIEVEIGSNWAGVYLLPEAAVKMVDYPSPADGVETAEDARKLCDTDDDGYIDVDAEDWCSWWWDTDSGYYYEFGTDYASTDADYRPNYLVTGTDGRGLLRFYVYIDSMPYAVDEQSGYDWGTAQIWATIGVSSTNMSINVEEGA